VAGEALQLSASQVEAAMAGVEPEPIREHYVVIGPRRYPPKQVLAAVSGLDRADFTTHQARSLLRRLGFGTYRRGSPTSGPAVPNTASSGEPGEASILSQFAGRWVAQDGDEILIDADSPEAVLRWLRRHNGTARVWRVPATPAETGSTLSAP
jgi:hypothetical protein